MEIEQYRVLIVEDNNVLCRVTQRQMRKLGFRQVGVANNFKDGRDEIFSYEYDVVVLDGSVCNDTKVPLRDTFYGAFDRHFEDRDDWEDVSYTRARAQRAKRRYDSVSLIEYAMLRRAIVVLYSGSGAKGVKKLGGIGNAGGIHYVTKSDGSFRRIMVAIMEKEGLIKPLVEYANAV